MPIFTSYKDLSLLWVDENGVLRRKILPSFITQTLTETNGITYLATTKPIAGIVNAYFVTADGFIFVKFD